MNGRSCGSRMRAATPATRCGALARDRGFTCAALLTLTVGIGATTAIFGGVNAVLLRPLPFPQPERLVFVFESGGELRFGVTAPDFFDWRRDQRVFEHIAGYATTTVTLSGSGDAERVPARRVSADYFRVLGVAPVVGRDFTEADDVFGAPRTVIVSDALWRSRFGADPSLVGTTLMLNGETHAVIGVLPPGVGLFERAEQFYLPLAIIPAERESTGSRFLTVIARLAPAVTREQAQTEMAAIAARIETIRPHSNTDVSARVDDLHQRLVGDLRQPLFFFMGAAVFLLLIACANVANLQLVRAMARQREVAIRSALGAGRRRLIRQFVMESIVLAALGGSAGLDRRGVFRGIDSVVDPRDEAASARLVSRSPRAGVDVDRQPGHRHLLWPDARMADDAPRSARPAQ